jgi:hypothetical protein
MTALLGGEQGSHRGDICLLEAGGGSGILS